MDKPEKLLTTDVKEAVPLLVRNIIWRKIDELYLEAIENKLPLKSSHKFKVKKLNAQSGRVIQEVSYKSSSLVRVGQVEVSEGSAINCDIYIVTQFQGELLMSFDF